MANKKQLEILKEGVTVWQEWRDKNRATEIDLTRADLSYTSFYGANLGNADLHNANLSSATLRRTNLSAANLSGANLHWADLRYANLSGADLPEADLSMAYLDRANLNGADLHGANLSHADLHGADLSGANLRWANLSGVDLRTANLSGTDLRAANLSEAILVGANLDGANLTDCRIYGISAWDIKFENATQNNLIITRDDEPILAVDELEVAQFIYLMLNNQKVKNTIDTVTSKTVLILGHFTGERKEVLDSIREELRQRGYMPILFDFEPSTNRDQTETVTLLARMARFIIVDLTDLEHIPQELTVIIPDLPSVPVQPIILSSQREYGMYKLWRRYPWVQEIQAYNAVDDLRAGLGDKIIAPAEKAIEKEKTRYKAQFEAEITLARLLLSSVEPPLLPES